MPGSSNLFRPTEIPPAVLLVAGVDPAPFQRIHTTGWEVAAWRGSWFTLTVYVTSHTVTETEQLAINHSFAPVDLPDRDASVYWQGKACFVAFPIVTGSIHLAVAKRLGARLAPVSTRPTALRIAAILNSYLPL